MYASFSIATSSSATPAVKRISYAGMIADIERADPGLLKAHYILDLLQAMKANKHYFPSVFCEARSKELNASLASSRPLLNLCKTGENTYFYPDTRGKHIRSTNNRDKASEAWQLHLGQTLRASLSDAFTERFGPQLA